MLEIIILTIVIVLAFIGASWYSYKRSQERAVEFERELNHNAGNGDEAFQQRFDSLFEHELQQQDKNATNIDENFVDTAVENTQREPAIAPAEDAELTVESNADTLPDDVNDIDMVIALTIMAPESNVFTGRAVKATLDHHQCHFGEMQIYHHFNDDAQKQILFSIANIIAPGTLLPDAFVSMKTPGLLIFTRLPGPVSASILFDELLKTALSIANELGGILCNDAREPIDQNGIEEMRTRILNDQMPISPENN